MNMVQMEPAPDAVARLTRSERLVMSALQGQSRPVLLSEISEAVWPGESSRREAVRVLVSRIRKKLGRGVILTGDDCYVLGALERCEHCGGSGFVRPSR